MAVLCNRGTALRTTSQARKSVSVGLQKPRTAHRPITIVTNEVPPGVPSSPFNRGPTSAHAAAVECSSPAPAPALPRPELYLLHCHLPDASGLGAQQHDPSQPGQLHKLRDDLKMMEKVAKKAAWFSTVEASDGEHVLLVTDCAKHARKYALQRLPDDAESFSLELPGRTVVVPLADVAAALRVQSDSESEEHEGEGAMQAGLAAMACEADDKAAKKARKEAKRVAKEEKKAAKMAAKNAKMGDADDSEEDSDAEEHGRCEGGREMGRDAAVKEDDSDSEDEDEGGKVVTKAKKTKGDEEEDKREKKKDKEGKKKEQAGMEKGERESDEESSSESSDEEEAAIEAVGEAKPAEAVMEDEESGSHDDESSSSESGSESGSEDEVTMPVAGATAAPGTASPPDLSLVL